MGRVAVFLSSFERRDYLNSCSHDLLDVLGQLDVLQLPDWPDRTGVGFSRGPSCCVGGKFLPLPAASWVNGIEANGGAARCPRNTWFSVPF